MQGHTEACIDGSSLYAAKRRRPDTKGTDTALYPKVVAKRLNEVAPPL